MRKNRRFGDGNMWWRRIAASSGDCGELR